MSNKYATPEPQKRPRKSQISPDATPHLQGSIAQTIGTGENAKDSIVYLVIKWSFYSGLGITYIVVCNNWFFRKDEKVPDIVGDIESSWAIVIPIITLALGYYFGKITK